MRRAPKTDPGLAEIDRWVHWFRAAHSERIATLGLAADEQQRELAVIEAQAEAIHERLRSDYLVRTQR
jgi:hypothetical protein